MMGECWLTVWIGDPQLAIDRIEPTGVKQPFDSVLRVSRFSWKFFISEQEVLGPVVRELRLLIRRSRHKDLIGILDSIR